MSQKAGETAATEGRGGSPPERWSVQEKTDVVSRLLRGEDLGEVAERFPQWVVESSAAMPEWRKEHAPFRLRIPSSFVRRIGRDLRAEAVRFGPKRILQTTTGQGLEL